MNNRHVEEDSLFGVKRRSRLETRISALKSISNGVHKPTNIMNANHFSWVSTKECIRFLIERDMIDEHVRGKRKAYTITEKGINFLELASKISEVML